jgi:hypothetical protein
MMFQSSPSFFLLMLLSIGDIRFARTQDVQPPCPPPGLETVVSTPEECNCFYAFAASDLEDYQSNYATDSILHYAQAGKYVGPDGISEYTSFATNGVFVSEYTSVGNPVVLNVTSTALGQCKVFVIENGNWHANPKYTLDNEEGCASTTVGLTFTYSLTGNPEAMISVNNNDVWLPNNLLSEFFPLFTSSDASANYVCDQIVNTCKDYAVDQPTRQLKASKKQGKKVKAAKKAKKGNGTGISMEECLKKYHELPDLGYPNSGDVAFVDGNSKGCRVLHSFFAANNKIHCPHISFEAEADINGQFKCNESAGTLLSDVFTEAEIGQILFVGQNVFGFDASGGRVVKEACPE